MLREILNKLSGGHITAMVIAAILAPTAVTAAVTFSPVAIVDPVTGKQSRVDNAGRLSVSDQVSGYRNNPANIVSIYVSNFGSVCETSQQYAVPAGKALVVTATSGYAYTSSSSALNSGFDVFDGASCTGSLLTAYRTAVSATSPTASVATDLGVGFVVKAGRTVSVFSSNNVGYTFLHGYLVPAGAVPALAPANAPKQISAAEVQAKLKQH